MTSSIVQKTFLFLVAFIMLFLLVSSARAADSDWSKCASENGSPGQCGICYFNSGTNKVNNGLISISGACRMSCFGSGCPDSTRRDIIGRWFQCSKAGLSDCGDYSASFLKKGDFPSSDIYPNSLRYYSQSMATGTNYCGTYQLDMAIKLNTQDLVSGYIINTGVDCSGVTPPASTNTPTPRPTTPPAATATPPSSTNTPIPNTPTPTAPQSISCNSDVTLSAVPLNPRIGEEVVFRIPTGDASTWIDETWTSNLSNCRQTRSAVWNDLEWRCTANSSGTYTWTHEWKHCVGNINNCSTRCEQRISGTIQVGPSITPSVTPSITPSVTPGGPSITPSVTPSPTPTSGPGEPNSCGGTCGSNYNCKAELFCYRDEKLNQSYCRNPRNPNSTTCAEPGSTPVAPGTPKTGFPLWFQAVGLSGLAYAGFKLRKLATRFW